VLSIYLLDRLWNGHNATVGAKGGKLNGTAGFQPGHFLDTVISGQGLRSRIQRTQLNDWVEHEEFF